MCRILPYLPVAMLSTVIAGRGNTPTLQVDLDLAASPIRISLSTDPSNYVRNSQRFAGIVVSAKVDGCYHHLRARSSGREKLEVCAPFATGALTEETV